MIQWLCAHAPDDLTPDQLTAIGVFGAFAVFIGYLASRVHPAFLFLTLFGYIINWYGDSLDGSLARYRHIEQIKFGYFLDHSADAFSILLILLGLGLSGTVELDVALFVLLGYFLMCIHVFLAVHVTGQFRLSYLSVGPTELRVGLMLLTGLMFFSFARRAYFGLTIIDFILCANAALLAGLFLFRTFSTLRDLKQAETRPAAEELTKSAPIKLRTETSPAEIYAPAEEFAQSFAKNSSIWAK